MVEISEELKGEVKFSFSEALHISFEHIRKRPIRSLITAASIILGIAFMVFLLMMDVLYRIGASDPVQSLQYWLVFISLIVCVIGITNSMLIAVHERYKEIGTMKCLGALDQHILKLFLTESMILSLVGGVSGFLIGAVTSLISSSFLLGLDVILRIPAYNILSLLLFSVTLSISLSIAATFYPAYRAAKLSPVEALRYEL